MFHDASHLLLGLGDVRLGLLSQPFVNVAAMYHTQNPAFLQDPSCAQEFSGRLASTHTPTSCLSILMCGVNLLQVPVQRWISLLLCKF